VHRLLTSNRTSREALLRLIRKGWSIQNEWHWARITQLGDDTHRYANQIAEPVNTFLRRWGGRRSRQEAIADTSRRLPLHPPRLSQAGQKYQRNADTGERDDDWSQAMAHTFRDPCIDALITFRAMLWGLKTHWWQRLLVISEMYRQPKTNFYSKTRSCSIAL